MLKKIVLIISVLLLFSTNCFAEEKIDFSKMQFTYAETIQSDEMEKIEKATAAVVKDEIQSGIFKVNLRNLQNDYTYEVIKIDSSYTLYLFGMDKNSELKLIGKYEGDGIINYAKVDVYYCEDYLEVMSQRAFSAYYSDLVLKWDGSQIAKMTQKNGDPSLETLKKERELIYNNDFSGFEKLVNSDEGAIFYPMAYQDYGNMGLYAIQTCHSNAVTQYQKGKPKDAAKTLEAGINIFFKNEFLRDYCEIPGYDKWNWKDVRTLTREKIQTVLDKYKSWQSGFSGNTDKLLSVDEFAAILNDYAFFLAESHQNKDAKPFLEKVIQLCPKRAVAYINLADVNWDIGNRKDAKAQYAQYLKLLGKNTKNVPKRVFDRGGLK